MNYTPELRQPAIAGLVGDDLDLGSVPNGAQVSVFYDDMLRDDQVQLRWDSSAPDAPYTETRSVQADATPLIFTVPYRALEAALGLTSTVDYIAVRNGLSRQSYPRTVNIRATPLPWPVPRVLDASGDDVNTLNPINAATGRENTATVIVTDARLTSSHTVSVQWIRSNGGTPPITSVPVSTPGEVRVPIPREVLAVSIDQQITVSYQIVRGNEEVGRSPQLTLSVLALPQSTLPSPVMAEANGQTVLDLNQFNTDATAQLAPWPFITPGQQVCLTLSGTDDDDQARQLVLLDGHSITPQEAAQGINLSVPRSHFLRLMNGSQVALQATVAFSPDSHFGDHTMFPVQPINLNQLQLTLPPPQAPQVDPNGTIDLEALNGRDLDINVAYTGNEPGQKVQLLLSVPGSAPAKPVFAEVTQPGSMAFKIRNADLQANTGLPMSLSYTVRRTADAVAEASITLPLTATTPAQSEIPDIENFTSGRSDQFLIPEKVRIDYPALVLSCPTTNIDRTMLRSIAPVPSYFENVSVELMHRAVAVFELKREARKVIISAMSRNREGEVTFYDKDKQVIGRQAIPAVFGSSHVIYETTSKKIASFHATSDTTGRGIELGIMYFTY